MSEPTPDAGADDYLNWQRTYELQREQREAEQQRAEAEAG
jgi:hypothetical protein